MTNSNMIAELIKYIEEKKREFDRLNKEYLNLSKDFTPVPYRHSNFFDKVFKKRYAKYQIDFQSSEETKKKLRDLNEELYLLNDEINRLTNFLYTLQPESSQANLHNTSILNKQKQEKEH